MNILHISPFSYSQVGGVSEHVRNICSRLAKEHNVTVYVTDSRSSFPRCELNDGVRVERFGRYAPSNAYFFSLGMLLALRKADFDIVHAHCHHAFPMHFSIVAKCKKLVVTTHFHGVGHSTFRNSLFRLLKPFGKRTLRKAHKIIAVSEYEKALIQEEFRFDPSKVVVIPNGVDLKEFSGLQRQKHDVKRVLYVGNLHEYKGVHYLVEVLPKLRDDVILEIVGRGPIKDSLVRRTERLGVKTRVRFYENLSRRELLQKYVDADVFVLLSRYEAYSLVMAEALTARTPCVVADTSALSEWIDNESCFGISFPIDLNELAYAINRHLYDHREKRNVDRRMEAKILEWNKVVRRLEDIYEE